MTPEVCKYFLSGSCHHGKSCFFRHQKPNAGQKSPTVVCKYFPQGKCVYGDKCTRSHNVKGRSKAASDSGSGSGSDGIKWASKSNPRKPSIKNQADLSDASSNYEREDRSPSPERRAEELVPPQKDACIFYTQGLCQAGESCEFLHSSMPVGDAQSGISGPNLTSKSRKQDKNPIICKHFQRGSCRLGDKCKYEHINCSQSSPIIDKGISGDDQFPPSVPTSPSAPGSPAGNVSREMDSGFEDMTALEDNNPSKPEEQWQSPVASPGESREAVDYDDWRQEQNEEVLDDQPAINSLREKGKGNERDTSVNGDNRNWENGSSQSHGESSPNIVVAQDLQLKASEGGEDQHDGNRSRARPSRYYGDGWEDKELGSPYIPPHTTQRTNEHSTQATPGLYPHVSEVKLHWSHFADPLADAGTAFCKLLAQGKCLQDDSCRFRHSLTPEEYTLLFLDRQPNLWTLKRSSSHSVDKSRTQKATHPIPASHTQLGLPRNIADNRPQPAAFGTSSVKECSFFALGKCRNGDICPYRHVQPPEGLVVASDPAWGTREPLSVGIKSARPCRFFMNKGYCNMRDSCRFQHSGRSSVEPQNKEDGNGWAPWEDTDNNNDKKDDGWEVKNVDDNGWGTLVDRSGWGAPQEQSATTKEQNRPGPCRQFSRTGTCSWDGCKFSHDAEPTNSAKESSTLDKWPEEENSSPGAPWAQSPVPPCPYFLKGRCKYEETCEYRHEAPQAAPQEPGGSTESQAQGETSRTRTGLNKTGLDAEESWNTPWPIPEISSQLTRTKINAPCKGFGQGYCRFGDQCDYLHINNTEPEILENEISGTYSHPSIENTTESLRPPPSVEVELVSPDGGDIPATQEDNVEEESASKLDPEPEPIVFDHPEVKRLIMSCEVTVGHDASPGRIVSASDCTKILLRELPAEVSPSDVTALCGKYGRVQQVIGVDSSPTTSDIRVDFAETIEAITAVRNLNGYIFEGRPLLASLKARMQLTIRAPGAHVLSLKVTWPNPNVSAWVHYQTISKAKTEAARLNDFLFRGRSIKASFFPPPRTQRDSFAIKVERLPPDVTKAEMEELCAGNTHIALNRPSYNKDPMDAISAALDEYKGLEGFDPLPGNSDRATSIAFASFKGESMARAILEKLDSTKHEFLGNQSLTFRPIYYSRHRLLREQYEALANEVDRVTESCEKRCSVQVDDHPDKNFLWIRVYSPFEHGPSPHAELERLLSGAVLQTQDGTDLWDDYFELPSSAKALKQLSTNAYIHRDVPARNIKVFGSREEREEIQKSINKLLTKVRSQRHEIALSRPTLHPVINGTLAMLKADVGLNKVSLDVFNSKLIVRGSSGDVSKAKSILESINAPPAPIVDVGLCQICLQKPVNAIILSCHHEYCTPCLQFAIQQAGYGPVQCVARHGPSDDQKERCQAHVPYVVIRDVLPAVEEKQFLISSFHHFVRSNPSEVFFCPSLNCQTTYRRSGEEDVNLKCKFCLSDVCTFCKSLAHVGFSCAEIRPPVIN